MTAAITQAVGSAAFDDTGDPSGVLGTWWPRGPVPGGLGDRVRGAAPVPPRTGHRPRPPAVTP